MKDVVVDSSVAAKWVLPEADSDQADRVFTECVANKARLIVLDLGIVEVANAIWKRFLRGLISAEEARASLDKFMKCPVDVQIATSLLRPAFEIATKYRRAVYDAMFVALCEDRDLPGVTADEPLYEAVHADFPNILLLRNWPSGSP